MSVDAALRETPVREIMVRRLQTVTAGEVLRDALRQMVENGVGSLIVLNEGVSADDSFSIDDVKGMVPVFFALQHFLQEGGDTPVEAALFRDLITVEGGDTLATALDHITSNRTWRLLVVDEMRRVIGLISATDILKFVKAQLGAIY